VREFDLIALLRQRLAANRTDTRLGIGDDAALVAPVAGVELAVTTDTLIAGRHFPKDTPAVDAGFKSVAVNLSDLAAMGAEPAWLTVALATPALDADWCRGFVEGLLAATCGLNVDFVGGDTTKSEVLTVSITAMGTVPCGQALRRDGARVGDLIAVTGTLGDAAAGLALWPQRAATAPLEQPLIARLTRPTARQGGALRGLVNAAIDISDGLLADLGHILHASNAGATVNVDALPCSEALASYATDQDTRRRLQATGGDDYELCVTLAPQSLAAAQQMLDCPLRPIGHVEPEPGLRLVDANRQPLQTESLGRAGWDHFEPDADA
jgi:thiamine-monophosphate kinase